jgi:hypothetical protein
MNSKEILGNLIIAGGLLTAAKAGTDLAANKKVFAELSQENAITTQLRSEYGIGNVCGEGICYDVVKGAKSPKEQQAILDEYYSTLRTEMNAIPKDPVAERWGFIDSGLILGGLAAAGAEVASKIKK